MRVENKPRKPRAKTHVRFYALKIEKSLMSKIVAESKRRRVSLYRLCVLALEEACRGAV